MSRSSETQDDALEVTVRVGCATVFLSQKMRTWWAAPISPQNEQVKTVRRSSAASEMVKTPTLSAAEAWVVMSRRFKRAQNCSLDIDIRASSEGFFAPASRIPCSSEEGHSRRVSV
ncbi:hypothetical protein T484DRAFT_1904660 [Baffinella frigidus]|nr:hypothetical protein T484DRAFT_1904660 [Cryptophyta sp. CCMP2293]